MKEMIFYLVEIPFDIPNHRHFNYNKSPNYCFYELKGDTLHRLLSPEKWAVKMLDNYKRKLMQGWRRMPETISFVDDSYHITVCDDSYIPILIDYFSRCKEYFDEYRNPINPLKTNTMKKQIELTEEQKKVIVADKVAKLEAEKAAKVSEIEKHYNQLIAKASTSIKFAYYEEEEEVVTSSKGKGTRLTWDEAAKKKLMLLKDKGFKGKNLAEEMGRSIGAINQQLLKMKQDEKGEKKPVAKKPTNSKKK